MLRTRAERCGCRPCLEIEELVGCKDGVAKGARASSRGEETPLAPEESKRNPFSRTCSGLEERSKSSLAVVSQAHLTFQIPSSLPIAGVEMQFDASVQCCPFERPPRNCPLGSVERLATSCSTLASCNGVS